MFLVFIKFLLANLLKSIHTKAFCDPFSFRLRLHVQTIIRRRSGFADISRHGFVKILIISRLVRIYAVNNLFLEFLSVFNNLAYFNETIIICSML